MIILKSCQRDRYHSSSSIVCCGWRSISQQLKYCLLWMEIDITAAQVLSAVDGDRYHSSSSIVCCGCMPLVCVEFTVLRVHISLKRQ